MKTLRVKITFEKEDDGRFIGCAAGVFDGETKTVIEELAYGDTKEMALLRVVEQLFMVVSDQVAYKELPRIIFEVKGGL